MAAHYIRRVIVVTDHPTDEEDEPESDAAAGVRIVVCMSRDASERLLRAQYLQSDMAFKCVVGFYEFELAAIDRSSNSSE